MKLCDEAGRKPISSSAGGALASEGTLMKRAFCGVEAMAERMTERAIEAMDGEVVARHVIESGARMEVSCFFERIEMAETETDRVHRRGILTFWLCWPSVTYQTDCLHRGGVVIVFVLHCSVTLASV